MRGGVVVSRIFERDTLWMVYFRMANTISYFIFFFNDTATTEIYTLSLHDALPISPSLRGASRKLTVFVRLNGSTGSSGMWKMKKLLPLYGVRCMRLCRLSRFMKGRRLRPKADRKSTRLNSSHRCISYAVFCLKKKIINHFFTLLQ